MPQSTRPRYRERLSPPWWFWVAAAFWALTLALAYGYAVSTPVGLGVGLAAFALAALGLSRVSATVVVDDRGFTAGPAHLPWDAVGTVEPLDASAAKLRRGPAADPRAYLMLRGWVSTAVAVDVRDRLDPTPYWFVSTRFPDRLAAALRQGVDAASDATDGEDVTGSSRAPSVEEGTP
ncbi:MAG TPA: DUF3093 domain-containing protein [Actinomycetes bacterium]|nr:DUF3093 domain-containing protein [Actinomycetes bacterium]